MTSPFISRSWLSNQVTGITYSGCFKNHPAEAKQSIDNLLNSGLMKMGAFLVNGKKESFAKISPSAIRSDPHLLSRLNSYGITIGQYEESFRAFSLPFKILLNQNGIDLILNDVHFVDYYHLFIHQSEFSKQVQQRIEQGLIREVNINSKKFFVTTSGRLILGAIGRCCHRYSDRSVSCH